MNTEKIKLSIIIGNYMKASRVVENVKSLLLQEVDFNFKIFVSDNSCKEEQANILKEGLKEYENVEVIINSANIGYIRQHNAVKNKLQGDYIFILNADILFKEKDVLKKIVDYMEEHSDIGILGPRQINETGETAMNVRAFPKLYLQVARRTFLRNFPILKKKVAYDEMRHLDYYKTQDVDWIQSSCVIIRRDLWEKIGGFNELYFLFMSDAEICVEAWRRGYRVVLFADTEVYADGKRLSAGGFLKFFQSWFIRQHVIDSIKYRLKNIWRPNPRKKYYKDRGMTDYQDLKF